MPDTGWLAICVRSWLNRQAVHQKCIRGFIPKFLSVLPMEPWLRNDDPNLNGKRNFCYCLSTEQTQLSISSVVGCFLHVRLLIGSFDGTGRTTVITPVACTCIIRTSIISSPLTCYAWRMRIQPSYAKGANLLKHLCKDELSNLSPSSDRTARVTERLELPSLITGLRVRISLEAIFFPNLLKRRFIAQSLSRSSFHRPEMTEILLKGRNIQNSSIHPQAGITFVC